MNDIQIGLILVGIPTIVCGIAGAIHARRPKATAKHIWIGALLLSALTSWSVVIGGAGDMPLPALLPSWIISPLGPFLGWKTVLTPPWWLTPWLPFFTYWAVARVRRETAATAEVRS